MHHHGTEFCLILAVQNHSARLRTRHDHPAYMQTTFTNNHRVERLWPEINHGVSYPETILVASIGLIQFIQSWNSHRIDGRNGGVPNQLAHEYRNTTRLPDGVIPSIGDAVTMYEASGGYLSHESLFGFDPLSQHP